jgi:hypothetical protein
MGVMAPMLGSDAQKYAFTRCSINHFKKILLRYDYSLDRYKINKGYNCLIKKGSESNNFIEYYKKWANYKQLLPGYYYSLSDQCRFMSGVVNSLALSVPKNECQLVECLIGEREVDQFVLMDGTRCGEEKICHSAQCLSIEKVNAMNGVQQGLGNPNSNYFSDRLRNSARLLRELCPQGTDQEELAETHGYMKHTCDDALLNYNYDLCNGLPYMLVCCEKCLKYKLNKCANCSDETRRGCMRQHHECEIVTCENLTENPCYNGGVCVTNRSELNIVTAKTAFYCKCPKGYSGEKLRKKLTSYSYSAFFPIS